MQALKFLEHQLLAGQRNAHPRVNHLDAHGFAQAAATDKNAPLSRIFNGIGDEILQHPPQQPPVGAHSQAAGHEGQPQALGSGDGLKFQLKLFKDVINTEMAEFRFHGTGVKTGNFQQRRENFLDSLQRGIDILRQLQVGVVGFFLALHQRGGIKPRGIQRLQNVMAGGGQKACFGEIGAFGLLFGAGQLLIEAGEFFRALAHALFQGFVGGFQLVGSRNAFGHISIGGDKPAVRQAGRAGFNHAVTGQAQAEGFCFIDQGLQAARDSLLKRAGAIEAAHGIDLDDMFKTDTDMNRRGRQIKQVKIFTVPAHQPQVRVAHRDALPCMVERVLQQVSAVLDCG